MSIRAAGERQGPPWGDLEWAGAAGCGYARAGLARGGPNRGYLEMVGGRRQTAEHKVKRRGPSWERALCRDADRSWTQPAHRQGKFRTPHP